jgi:pre-rRNA-processing protein TSR1
MFAAEQTWPTEEEFKHAQASSKQRRTSEEEAME